MRRDERVTDEMVEKAAAAYWFEIYGRHRKSAKWPDDVFGRSEELFRAGCRAALSAALEVEQQVGPAAKQWCAYEDGHQHTSWYPDGYGDRAGWEALAKRNPVKYQIVTRPLYTHPPVSALVNAQADADVVEIPAEPTDEMIEAGEEEIASRRSHGCRVYASDIWAAMVSSLRPAEVGSATLSSGAYPAGRAALEKEPRE